MTATLTRGGGLTAFRLPVTIHAPHSEQFAQALQDQRFRTIENAASEETSFGWVTPEDPTGDSFEIDDMALNALTWLRVRIDRKKLPTKWVRMHLEVAARERGFPLSARDRRELKADLAEQLLPRVLPTTQHIDAILAGHLQNNLVLVLSTSKGALDTFRKLFAETFGAELAPQGPLDRAFAIDVAAEKLEPVRWPKAKGGRK